MSGSGWWFVLFDQPLGDGMRGPATRPDQTGSPGTTIAVAVVVGLLLAVVTWNGNRSGGRRHAQG